MNDSEKCPLCGKTNECQLCTTDAYKGPCWCAKEMISSELLARVPAASRNRACICKACVTAFQQEQSVKPDLKIRPGDFYFNSSGLVVFTEAYHHCCGSGCRHCPYSTSHITNPNGILE